MSWFFTRINDVSNYTNNPHNIDYFNLNDSDYNVFENENEDDNINEELNNNENDSENNTQTDNNDNNFFMDYEDVMNEYLNNIQEIRQSLRQTINDQNTFLTRVQSHVNNLSRQNFMLYELILSHPQLSRRISNSHETIHSMNVNNNRSARTNTTSYVPRHQRPMYYTQPYNYNDILQSFYGYRNVFNRNLHPQNMQDVVITPSHQQINNACSTVTYGSIEENVRYYERCPISYLVFNENSEVLRINHCGHYFDKEALSGWFRNSVVCPVCRYDIRSNTNSTDENTENNTNNTGNTDNLNNVNNVNNSNIINRSPYHYQYTTTIPYSSNTNPDTYNQILSSIMLGISSMLNESNSLVNEGMNNNNDNNND